MKTRTHRAAAMLVCGIALGFAIHTKAVTLTVRDASYVGWIGAGPVAPAGNEFTWVNTLAIMPPNAAITIGSFPRENNLNRSANALDYPAMPAAVAFFKEEGARTDWTVGTGSLYLLGNYRMGREQTSHVWYLGAFAEGTAVSLLDPALSHATLFVGERTPVSDEGATVILLGGAFAGVGFARRLLKR